jgi:hypothetical protein
MAFSQQGGEVLDALCQFHDLTTSMEFEFNFIIPCGSVINGRFEANERLYHLARQKELTHTLNTRVIAETMLKPRSAR